MGSNMTSNTESWEERQENYRKNLACIQEVTDRLSSHMKGHGYSFRQEITDREGNFSQEKLCGLVKELVGAWVETLRENTDTDPDTGESLAESYIRERRELYGLYFYLIMRCSLCEGAYAKAYPYAPAAGERTDFAFLLEQARRLTGRWCVMAGPDGEKKNELYEGYDGHFGFHLYKTLADPEGKTADSTLSPWWNLPQDRLGSLTNEGNMKRIYIRHLSGSFWAVRAEETAQAEDRRDEIETDGADNGDGYMGCKNTEGTDVLTEDDCENKDVYADYDGYDDDDPYPFPDFETRAEFEAARMEQCAQEYERADYLGALALRFACPGEYLEACRRFAALFEKAGPEILRDFSQELEKIVNLYLAKRNLSPLTDTDKTLDVYSRVYDGPCKQARHYERRLQWENL